MDDHTSWSRDCPTFVRKCREFDKKHPENDLPYYPSTELWMCATGLCPPLITAPRFRPEEHLRPQQKTYPQRLRQQQIQFDSSQPTTSRSYNHPRRRSLDRDQPARATQENPPFPHPQLSNIDDIYVGAPPFNADTSQPTQ